MRMRSLLSGITVIAALGAMTQEAHAQVTLSTTITYPANNGRIYAGGTVTVYGTFNWTCPPGTAVTKPTEAKIEITDPGGGKITSTAPVGSISGGPTGGSVSFSVAATVPSNTGASSVVVTGVNLSNANPPVYTDITSGSINVNIVQ